MNRRRYINRLERECRIRLSSDLYFLDDLLAKRADFSRNSDGHVLMAAVLAADAIERARAILHAAAVQVRLQRTNIESG